MKKGASKLFTVFVFAFLLLSLQLVYSAENATKTEGFEKAYDYLSAAVTDRGYSELTSEEQAFALLALAYNSSIQGGLRSAIADSSRDNICWPSDSCRLKDTALVLIALNRINQPTTAIEDWFMEKKETPSDLIWYLQIDPEGQSRCKITYGTSSKTVTINEDKTLSGGNGGCFRSAYNNYWLEIDDDCYDQEFEISCDKSFTTTTTYRKRSSVDSETPFFVSAISHSGIADSSTKETVNALCFKQGSSSSCNYEGSLWAALALKKAGKDVDAYLPYLASSASSASAFLPVAFLFMLTGDEQYFLDLANQQKAEGYWQASDQSKRYYDTALALLALQGHSASTQVSTASEYLLNNQQTDGGWRNVRDTSFILYSAAPKNPAISTTRTDCEDSSNFCVSSKSGCESEGGTVYSNYYCSSPGKSWCCSKDITELLPDVNASNNDDTSACEERGYRCQSVCDSDTPIEKPYECSSIKSCCGTKTASSEGSSSGMLIILLIIFIILLILAIIFREQVKIWIFRIKNKFSKHSVQPQQRTQFPPRPMGPGGMRVMPGRMMPPQVRPGMRPVGRMPVRPQQPFPKESQLQETLRKLKEMGK